ncbi:MAG: hypothetical protein M3008_05685 [Chloroflexota bacterium]|nr:hypothetical protein [Chloroflexota bacterium]
MNTATPAVAASGQWRPVTESDGAAGARAVDSLKMVRGKVYASLTPSEAVAYLLQTTSKQLPPNATGVEAMVSGDRLNVRAVVSLAELGGADVLGPLASMMGSRDTVQLGGTVDLIRPGMAQFHLARVQVQSFTAPKQMIPRLVSQLRKDSPAGIAADALALPLPPYIGDIRIANGKVTLYKNVQ